MIIGPLNNANLASLPSFITFKAKSLSLVKLLLLLFCPLNISQPFLLLLFHKFTVRNNLPNQTLPNQIQYGSRKRKERLLYASRSVILNKNMINHPYLLVKLLMATGRNLRIDQGMESFRLAH